MKKYDVIVIGAGSAGLGNAGVANTIGLKTLLIEKRAEYFGGDCTNFGCVPSKALIHIAHQFHAAKQAQRFGLRTEGVADMKQVLAYIHEKQAIIRGTENAEALRAKGMEVLIGEAKFEDKETVRVGEERYTAKVILLCTGSKPRQLEIEGMEAVKVYTNENIFFDCKTLPKNLVVVGGGPIGCELGQAFARLGSQVTIVNRGDHLLSNEPVKVAQILTKEFEQEGIRIFNNTTVEKITNSQAQLKTKATAKQNIPCDALLMAVGRVVRTEGLQLEKAGIELTEQGQFKINEYLQSTNPRVYVVGDAAGTYMFSHGAEKMVRMLWRNLLFPLIKKKNTMADLSWVTFTDPQVAHFGYTEEQLNEKGIAYYRQDQSLEEDDRAILQEYTYGYQSLWMEEKSNLGNRKLISGSLIAPHAGELLQELELAKFAEIPIGKINNRVYPYPVQARINQKTIRGVLQSSYSATKMKLARWLFSFFN
ncbi:MAG: NAD(P)/FAD-dependent oxidoreductase [Saprospiraceae bacterium]